MECKGGQSEEKKREGKKRESREGREVEGAGMQGKGREQEEKSGERKKRREGKKKKRAGKRKKRREQKKMEGNRREGNGRERNVIAGNAREYKGAGMQGKEKGKREGKELPGLRAPSSRRRTRTLQSTPSTRSRSAEQEGHHLETTIRKYDVIMRHQHENTQEWSSVPSLLVCASPFVMMASSVVLFSYLVRPASSDAISASKSCSGSETIRCGCKQTEEITPKYSLLRRGMRSSSWERRERKEGRK